MTHHISPEHEQSETTPQISPQAEGLTTLLEQTAEIKEMVEEFTSIREGGPRNEDIEYVLSHALPDGVKLQDEPHAELTDSIEAINSQLFESRRFLASFEKQTHDALEELKSLLNAQPQANAVVSQSVEMQDLVNAQAQEMSAALQKVHDDLLASQEHFALLEQLVQRGADGKDMKWVEKLIQEGLLPLEREVANSRESVNQLYQELTNQRETYLESFKTLFAMQTTPVRSEQSGALTSIDSEEIESIIADHTQELHKRLEAKIEKLGSMDMGFHFVTTLGLFANILLLIYLSFYQV